MVTKLIPPTTPAQADQEFIKGLNEYIRAADSGRCHLSHNAPRVDDHGCLGPLKSEVMKKADKLVYEALNKLTDELSALLPYRKMYLDVTEYDEVYGGIFSVESLANRLATWMFDKWGRWSNYAEMCEWDDRESVDAKYDALVKRLHDKLPSAIADLVVQYHKEGNHCT